MRKACTDSQVLTSTALDYKLFAKVWFLPQEYRTTTSPTMRCNASQRLPHKQAFAHAINKSVVYGPQTEQVKHWCVRHVQSHKAASCRSWAPTVTNLNPTAILCFGTLAKLPLYFDPLASHEAATAQQIRHRWQKSVTGRLHVLK